LQSDAHGDPPRVDAGRVDRLFRCPLADPEPSAGNDRFQGEAWLLNRSAVGHEQTVVTSTEQTFERLLFFGGRNRSRGRGLRSSVVGKE
jgi:hypothetical protein